jgi:hypothetical protein
MKIQFSYIFDEELERVYECFTDFAINCGITFKNVISQLHFIKGEERFDAENSEYIALWKNYYEIKMVVENIKKEPSFRTYTNRSLSIDKLPSGISLVYSFYWNSIEEKTIFILEFIYKDEFFADLYKNEFNKSDKVKICNNVEQYLNAIIKGLEISNSIIINSSFENIWKDLVSPKIFFNILFIDFVIICKDEPISSDTEIMLYSNKLNPSNPIPLIKFLSDSIVITSKYCLLSFITKEKWSIPNQKFSVSIKFLDKHKSLFSLNIKIMECISHEVLINLRKLWKKKIVEFIKYIEAKK